MNGALRSAATGLKAQQANIDRLSSDLANVNTDGYKRTRNEFQDLMYQTIKEPGARLGDNTIAPVGVQRGTGVRVAGQHKIYEQGPSRMTYRPFDFMIEGKGFFPIETPQGDIAYTRNGMFRVNKDGIVETSQGAKLIPEVTVPSNSLNVTVTHNGEIKATLPELNEVVIGQIQLVTFQNLEGLAAVGNSLFMNTEASGPPIQGLPTESSFGSIQQGALEGSNVNVANSMVDMITTQRAYEMNTKVMKVADEMMQSTVNIK